MRIENISEEIYSALRAVMTMYPCTYCSDKNNCIKKCSEYYSYCANQSKIFQLGLFEVWQTIEDINKLQRLVDEKSKKIEDKKQQLVEAGFDLDKLFHEEI